MTEHLAELIWLAVAAYAAAGAVIASALVLFGLRRLDPAGVAPPWRVVIVLAPGLIALWPLLLTRLAHKPREDRA